MKRLIWVMLLVLLFTGVSYAGIFMEEISTGKFRIKVVYMDNGDKLIINYFKKDAIAQDLQYKHVGIEIYVDGEKVKDTFRDND